MLTFLSLQPGEFRSIMSYSSAGEKRVNHYSSPDNKFSGHPTGTEEDNNARALTEVRFVVANIGDEAMECPVEASNKALSFFCRDKYRSCSLVASSCCWDPLISSGCPESCGLCPGMLPKHSTTCFNMLSNCQELAQMGGCEEENTRKECRESCGGCV